MVSSSAAGFKILGPQKRRGGACTVLERALNHAKPLCFPRPFLLPSHAEAEGLGIGLRCHGVGDTQVDHRRWLLLPLLLLLLLLLLLPMRSVFLSR